VQLNSETDFVARNVLFQSLAQRAAAGALAVLPRALDTVTSEAAGGEGSAAALAGAAALAAAPLPGGLVGGAGVGATPCTTAEGVAGVIAQVRENCVLRRASALGGPGCLVVPYAHNSPGAGLGSIGVLVALRSSGGGGGAPLPASPALTLLGRRLAMHIAAAAPAYLSRAGVPAAVLERERAVLAEQQGKDVAGKPPAIAQKIMEGKLGKFYSECVLLEQAFALGDGSVKVGKWVEAEARAAGAGSVEVAGFVCFRVGAGGGSGNAPAPA
jgi:elongation factor Ts